jgi:hypothetical protein
MEDSGAMDYLSMLGIWWFLAACSVIGFGLSVLLFMRKGKKRHSTKMETEQMLAHLLGEIRSGQEEMKDLLARVVAKLEANPANMNVKPKEVAGEIHSIRSELEETIEHRIQNVLTHVNHVTQSLQKEMIDGIENTQGDLETVKTSLDTRTKLLVESISDTRKGLHEELGLMFQVEAQTTKALIEANRREFQAQLEEIEARAGRGSRPAAVAAQPPTFDGTTSWAVFRRQLETVAEYNCRTQQGETHGNHQEGLNGGRVATETRIGRVINCRETSDGRRRGANVGVNTKALSEMKEEKLIALWGKRNRTCESSGHRR